MGGGSGSGAGTPTTPPGYTGGSVMEYTPPAYSQSPVQSGYQPPNWGQVAGTGLQSFAKGMGSGTTPVQPIPGAPSMGSAEFGTSQQSPVGIPQNQLMEALLRLLGGAGGAGGGY